MPGPAGLPGHAGRRCSGRMSGFPVAPGRTGGLRREEVAALAGVPVVAALPAGGQPRVAELWRSQEVDVTHA
ncbi:hypothetical protein SANTM175S_05510 [Streptomyces antimycoticus]